MKAEIVAEYINTLRQKTGLTFEAVAEKEKCSESTVKNLCYGKTEDPRISTVAPIIYAMGGSLDEMYNPKKNRDEIKETSVVALKDIYEFQVSGIKETSEAHINNIRAHYEQHHEDLKENFERRLADKKELNAMQAAHIKTLERECLSSKIFSWICIAILVSLLIAEVMNPNLGWFRY